MHAHHMHVARSWKKYGVNTYCILQSSCNKKARSYYVRTNPALWSSFKTSRTTDSRCWSEWSSKEEDSRLEWVSEQGRRLTVLEMIVPPFQLKALQWVIEQRRSWRWSHPFTGMRELQRARARVMLTDEKGEKGQGEMKKGRRNTGEGTKKRPPTKNHGRHEQPYGQWTEYGKKRKLKTSTQSQAL